MKKREGEKDPKIKTTHCVHIIIVFSSYKKHSPTKELVTILKKPK